MQVQPGPVRLAVVLPCLDEERTIGDCVREAARGLAACGESGEIVVADNGSRDGSVALASAAGARVVPVAERGYGAAIRCGVREARGTWVVMADADGSYDLSRLEPFVSRLRGGDDLVMGNRFRGTIAPGAMPFLNRYLGNPVLTGLGRLLFPTPVRDFHCGMRAFSRVAFDRLALTTCGMEFASEVVARAVQLGMRISEVPVDLRRDGRARPSHLRPWRDGLRHLRLLVRLRLAPAGAAAALPLVTTVANPPR